MQSFARGAWNKSISAVQFKLYKVTSMVLLQGVQGRPFLQLQWYSWVNSWVSSQSRPALLTSRLVLQSYETSMHSDKCKVSESSCSGEEEARCIGATSASKALLNCLNRLNYVKAGPRVMRASHSVDGKTQHTLSSIFEKRTYGSPEQNALSVLFLGQVAHSEVQVCVRGAENFSSLSNRTSH